MSAPRGRILNAEARAHLRLVLGPAQATAVVDTVEASAPDVAQLAALREAERADYRRARGYQRRVARHLAALRKLADQHPWPMPTRTARLEETIATLARLLQALPPRRGGRPADQVARLVAGRVCAALARPEDGKRGPAPTRDRLEETLSVVVPAVDAWLGRPAIRQGDCRRLAAHLLRRRQQRLSRLHVRA